MVPSALIAPAKINLTLRVIKRRSDGLHELRSLVAFADFGDAISLGGWTNADSITSKHRYDSALLSDAIQVSVSGPFASGICPRDNLLHRAVDKILQQGIQEIPTVISLVKNIPAGAGLGGGSADAAALLRAVNAYDSAASAEIGADVPVCLKGRSAWVGGIGELISPVLFEQRIAAVLVWPNVALSTAQMFAKLGLPFNHTDVAAAFEDCPSISGQSSDIATSSSRATEDAFEVYSSQHIVELMRTHGSSFEQPACEVLPSVEKCLSQLRKHTGVLAAQLSGSGSACVAICSTDDDAATVAAHMQRRFPDYWVRTCTLGDMLEQPNL